MKYCKCLPQWLRYTKTFRPWERLFVTKCASMYSFVDPLRLHFWSCRTIIITVSLFGCHFPKDCFHPKSNLIYTRITTSMADIWTIGEFRTHTTTQQHNNTTGYNRTTLLIFMYLCVGVQSRPFLILNILNKHQPDTNNLPIMAKKHPFFAWQAAILKVVSK